MTPDVLTGAVLLTAEQSQGPTVAEELVELLVIFLIAAGVGTFVAKVGRFPYTIALLLAGLAVSVLITFVFESPGIQNLFGIELTHDLILLVLLPALLFEGAATTDLARFKANFLPILVMAVVGLLISVVLLGLIGQYAFGFPLLVSLLFAAMILPTDPVSVLALFKELGAPDRLAVLVEGESLINDGVGVVLFTTLFTLVQQGAGAADLATPSGLAEVAFDITVNSVGGLFVGLAAGYAVYRVMVNLDEHMTEIVLTLILAYGSFILAEHYLHVSGVIATVVAGLFIGNRGAEYAMSARTKVSVFNTWETGAFIVNTFIFVAIGVETPINRIIANANLIAIAIPLVLLARAVVVYPISAITNVRLGNEVPLNYQHVLVWGGLHGSIPIALALGLPADTPGLPTERLKAMVFGVAAFSLVVQGLSMKHLLDYLGVVTRTDAEQLYELLAGRARAVKSALEAVERLNQRGDIPSNVYQDFVSEYGREKDDLDHAIATLLRENPGLRREQMLAGERQVLQREKSAIMDAARTGVISEEVADRLTEEVDLKLGMIRSGESTVRQTEEGYTEFWRERAREYGLPAEVEPSDEDTDGDRVGADEPEDRDPD